jgi:hypothetical protein
VNVAHPDLRHAVVRDARLVRRSLLAFAFPINPQFRRGLVGALSVSVLLVWGAWVPARSHAAGPQAQPAAHVQTLR